MRFSKSIEELSGHTRKRSNKRRRREFPRFDDNSYRILLVLRYKAADSYSRVTGKLIYRVPLVA